MDRLFIFLCMILYLMLVIDSIEAIFRCDSAHRRFQCKNGQCLTLRERCDFKVDCFDKSDEEGCVYPACDNTTRFQCNNKKCIHKEWVCDGSDDCFDNSDEAEELCSAHSCTPEQFHCYRSTECLPLSYKCDGEEDCEDGEDEKNCPSVECGDKEFQCANKRECVDIGFKCDGEKDCEDGSDESADCTIICREDEFLCASLDQCLMGTWKCDGVRDCKDGSDEKNCTSDAHKCSKGYIPCAHTSLCIPEDWRCDGDRECSDGSDELNCDNFKKRCPYSDRLCANHRQCINKSKWCDGTRDCVDKSDETECPVHSHPSSDCPHTTHFRCPGKNGSCILEHRMCDGFTDCKGGEDEQQGPHFCGYDECVGPTNGNCSHICVDKRLSYECDCPPGLKLGADKMTCEDVNECESVDNPCDRYCFNTNGSYKCACDEGHVLVRGRHCKPSKPRYDVQLVVTDRNKIEHIKLDKRPTVSTVLSNINVESVAVDIKNDSVYWSDAKTETITRDKMAGGERKIILDRKHVTSPRGLAVDWIHNLLFWIDTEFNAVSVVSLNDLEHPKTLFKGQGSMIVSIAIHPKMGYIYSGHSVTSGKDSGFIERRGMDGSQESAKKITTERIEIPTDIAIDYEQSLLYWVDNMLNILVVSDLDGNNRRDVVIETHNPFSVAVFEGKVFFTDSKHHQILSTNRTGGNLKVVASRLSAQTDVVVVNPGAQPNGTNLCAGNTCDMLCLPKASGSTGATFSCVCPDHYTKSTDSCVPMPTTSTTTSTTTTSTTTESSTTNEQTKKTSSMTTAPSSAEGNSTFGGTDAVSKGSTQYLIIVIGVIALIALIAVILWTLYRRRRQRSARKSMNFNNPIYKKVTESIASSSSFPGLTDPSPTTSSGDISNHDSDGTAALVLNEELPEGSNADDTMVPRVRFTSEGRYTKIPNGTTQTEFPENHIEYR